MNPNLQQLIAQARDALAQGYLAEDIDRIMSEQTGGKYASLAAAEAALQKGVPAAPADVHPLDVMNPNSGARQMARMALHGGLLGFSDELAGAGAALVPGGKSYTEARDASGERVDQIRSEHPIAGTLAELAGSAVLPIGAVGAGAKLAARVGAGALTGGLLGFGEEDGDFGDRAKSGAIGVTAGAATAGLLHGAGKAVKAVGRTVKALGANTSANALAERVAAAGGAPGGRIAPAQEAVKQRIARIQRDLYKPLEKQFGKIGDDEILRVLKHPDVAEATAEVIGTKAKPSLTDLQAIRTNLLGRAKAATRDGRNDLAERARTAHTTLTERMEARLPGLGEANSAYREAKAVEAAFDRGMRSLDTSVKTRTEAIEKQLADMTEDARDAFRAGMAARLYETLNTGGEVTAAQIRLVSKPKIRMMFTDDKAGPEAYEALMRDVQQLNRAVVVKGRLKSPRTWATLIGGMIGGGATYGGARIAGLLD